MAVYNPHLLAHKLCRVLDAGLISVDELAERADLSPEFVEKLARDGSVKTDRDTQLRISKVIGPLFMAHPELYREQRPAPKHGVIEESSPRANERSFTLRDTRGKMRMLITLPAAEVTPETIQWLWRILEKMDPAVRTAKLQVV